ncbi:MAG: hypothetical protein ABJD97_15165 [Betaproteobacteria bacterium]
MRLATLSLPLLGLALAACQAFAPVPDLATLPHATLTGSHVDVDGDRVDTFRATAIDGRGVLPLGDQPAKLIGKDAVNLLPAGHGVRVEVEGLAFYQNTVRRVFWDPMHTDGTIELVPVANASYVVRGAVAPEASSVWIEDAATHAVMGRKISTPGKGASAPAP